MTPIPLWHDAFEDALIDILKGVYGKGFYQKAAAEMYPTEDPTDKGKWLEKALNPERNEKLGLNDLLWILKKGREKGIHTGMFFLTDECNYTRPTTIEPEDKKAELVDRLERIAKEFNDGVKLLGKLK